MRFNKAILYKFSIFPLIFFLAACGITINEPASNALIPAVPGTTASNVNLRVSGTNQFNTVAVFLDGADVTGSLLGAQMPNNALFTATIPGVPLGNHNLRVTANVYQFFYSTTAEARSTFSVVPPGASVLGLGGPLTLRVLEKVPLTIQRTPAVSTLDVTLTAASNNVAFEDSQPNVPLTVTMAGGQATAAVNVRGVSIGADTLTAAAPAATAGSTNATVVPLEIFRATDSGLGAFNFNDPRNPVNLAYVGLTPSSGTHFVVGLAYNGDGKFLRATSTTLEAVPWDDTASAFGNPQSVGADPSVNGVAVAAEGDIILRTTDTALELFKLVNGAPEFVAGAPSVDPSSGGVGIDVLDAIAVRTTDSEVEAFKVTTDQLGTRYFSTGRPAVTTGRGVGIKLYKDQDKLRAVRVYESGIETFLIGVQNNGTLTVENVGYHSGSPSAGGVAVAVTFDGKRAVRSTDTTLELYDISDPANIRSLATIGANATSSGVGLITVGSYVLRATESGIEVYKFENDQFTVVNSNGPSGAGVSQSGTAIAIY